MYSLQYRNFGTHESLVVDHTVNVEVNPLLPDHAGVRYYEVRRVLTPSTGSFSINEQASFAPDVDHRWMGSAAMDHEGNLAVAYSVSGPSTFSSILYAGRLATADPATHGLLEGEATLQVGAGSQTSDFARWGDYTSLTVDPSDDCTFWYTNEYYTSTSIADWKTRIGKFTFASCTTPAQGILQGTVTAVSTGLGIEGALVQTSDGFARTTDATGHYSMTVPQGSYTVTASAPTYSSSTASVVVSDGGTTIRDFVLIANADLSVTKAASPNPVKLGGSLTYTITVTNNGPRPATGVKLTDTLPVGVTFVSVTPIAPTCTQASGVVTCNLETLGSGASSTVMITVTVPTTPGPITNTATATAQEHDPNLANIQQITTVSGPDLTGSWVSVQKKCDGTGAKFRCTITGNFAVRNLGLANAAGFVMQYYLSSDPILGGDTLLNQHNSVSFKPGQTITDKWSKTLPTGCDPAGQYVIANIDATNAVVENNELNNIIVFGPLP